MAMNRWTFWFSIVFLVICGSDYALVAAGYRSYSLIIWLAEQAHPTIILGVAVIGCGIAEAAWEGSNRIICFTVLLGTGHLCTSEGAAIAVAQSSRWLHAPAWQWVVLVVTMLIAIPCLFGYVINKTTDLD